MEKLNNQSSYAKYLSSTFCLFEMVKAIGMRELSLRLVLENKKVFIRYLLCYNLDFLKKHIERLQIKEKPRTFYMSCASFDRIPIFSYNLKTRRDTPEYKDFDKNYEKHIQKFDFFIDLDGKEDFNKCYQETKELKGILEEIRVPFYILNSSMNGFHIIIPSEYLPQRKPIQDLLKEILTVITNIKGIYVFDCLDTSIVDMKRLRKVPYSPLPNGYCCLPLTDQQFLQCSKSMDFLKIDNVLKDVTIKNRGLLTRTYGLSNDELKKNVKKFFEEYL